MIPNDQFKRVPFQQPNPAEWPKHVRQVTIDEIDALGIGSDGHLYWHGKAIEFRRPLELTWFQSFIAFVVAVFTVLGSIGAMTQGWAAYFDWSCKVGWRSVACPTSDGKTDFGKFPPID